jgi:hypothetical protein
MSLPFKKSRDWINRTAQRLEDAPARLFTGDRPVTASAQRELFEKGVAGKAISGYCCSCRGAEGSAGSGDQLADSGAEDLGVPVHVLVGRRRAHQRHVVEGRQQDAPVERVQVHVAVELGVA